jgi:AraC-like DNA-binding protein
MKPSSLSPAYAIVLPLVRIHHRYSSCHNRKNLALPDLTILSTTQEVEMSANIAIYRSPRRQYYADTCEPLKQAVARGEVALVARARGAYPGLSLPATELDEILTVGYWDANCKQRWGLDWHRNEGIELTYVARGRVAFAVDQQEYVLKRGALTITRPWQPHRVGSPNIEACCLHWIILDVGVRRPNQMWEWPKWLVLSEDDLAMLTLMLSHNEQPVWFAEDEVIYYFQKLGEEVRLSTLENNDHRAFKSRMKLYVNGLLIALAEMLKRNEIVLDESLSSTQRTVELFLMSLLEQADLEWTLDSMADACGLGRTQFTQYCKRMTNLSPIQYLTHCRVTMAKSLLDEQPDLTVTDTAFQCGFSSSQYFTKVFQQYVGLPPSQYRMHSQPVLAIEEGM